MSRAIQKRERRYEARGASRALHDIRTTQRVLLEGPVGCVAGETLLWDPIAKVARRFDDLCFTATRPWVQTLSGPVLAEAPFLKGYAPLYRVTLESGLSCLATADHLFRARDSRSWVRLSDLVPGMELLSTRDAGARRWTRIPPSSQVGCRRVSHFDGGPLRDDRGADRGPTPSRSDARGSSRAGWLADDQGEARAHIQTCLESALPSMQDSGRRRCCDASPQVRDSVDASASDGDCTGFDERSPSRGFLHEQGERSMRCFERTHRLQANELQWIQGTTCTECSSQWDPVTSVRYERTDFYYDLHVPGEEHYLADGIYSHNTGKTRAGLQWLDRLCWEIPYLRVALVREYRSELTKTALPILEDEVYWPGNPALTSNGMRREQRTEYRYPNGACIEVFGISDASGFMGAQYDIVYIVEATEGTLDTYEMMLSRALGRRRDQSNERVARIDFSVVVAECNPDREDHWLNELAKEGKIRRLVTRHADNPTLDGPHGLTYMHTLDGLHGYQRDRLYLGRWISAEGLIFKQWNVKRHTVPQDEKGPREVPHDVDAFLGSIDWGKRDAGVLNTWAIKQRVPILAADKTLTHTKRAWRVESVYRADKSLEWWKDQIIRVYKRYHPWWIYADPARPDLIEHMNAMLAPYSGRDPRGDPVIVGADNTKNPRAGDKGDMVGLDLVGWALNDAADGIPRLLFMRDSLLDGPDPLLTQARQPWCLEEEIKGYRYKKIVEGGRVREIPDDACKDHELDATRYFTSGFFRNDFRSYARPVPVEMEIVRPEHRSFAKMISKHGYEFFRKDKRFAGFEVQNEASVVKDGESPNPQLADDIDEEEGS